MDLVTRALEEAPTAEIIDLAACRRAREAERAAAELGGLEAPADPYPWAYTFGPSGRRD